VDVDPAATGAFRQRAGLAAGGVPAAPPALAPALASLDCGVLVAGLLAGCLAAVGFFLFVVALCLVAAGLPELLHEALAPLVGFPPKAQGMSSWKKCGMSVVKVRFTSFGKSSARAGAGKASSARNKTTSA